MATRTIENYLKQLYLEQQKNPHQVVAMGRLATLMGVVPGTATSMVKALADSGLVTYEPREGVRLSAQGRQLAVHVLRRHRLVELFLVQVIGLDWSEVHEEAEELEHVISDKVLARMDALLGHPAEDPHGDPIPTPHGHIAEDKLLVLSDAEINQPLEIARVLDQQPTFLQFVDQCGLMPGARIRIAMKNAQADALVITSATAAPVNLSTAAAAKFLVRQID